MNRRDLVKSVLGTLASYSLLETLFASDAFSSPVRPVTDRWVKDLNDMCRDLKTGRIAPAVWQAKVKELYDRIALPELLAAIDFDQGETRQQYRALYRGLGSCQFSRACQIRRTRSSPGRIW